MAIDVVNQRSIEFNSAAHYTDGRIELTKGFGLAAQDNTITPPAQDMSFDLK